MKRFTPIMWVASLSLLAVMGGMYLGGVGILVGSKQVRLVRQGGLAVPYDGKARPDQSPPFTVTICRYWEGFRVNKILDPQPSARCPLLHGLS